MKYVKPRIVCATDALATIQAPHIKGDSMSDGPKSNQVTVAAYAADE